MNLRVVNPKKEVEYTGRLFKEGLGYVIINKVEEAMLVAHNFVQIWRFLHPMDYGPQAMFRVLLERVHKDRISSTEPIRRYFSAVC